MLQETEPAHRMHAPDRRARPPSLFPLDVKKKESGNAKELISNSNVSPGIAAGIGGQTMKSHYQIFVIRIEKNVML
jgi:hypothetical protein